MFSRFGIPPYLCKPFPGGRGVKKYQKEVSNMLIIDSKDCENIDKALKKYKKKFEKSKVLLQLRERQSFTKPSVRRRDQVLKAIYKQKIASGKIEA
jgi:small subunit ribosomal protein S21